MFAEWSRRMQNGPTPPLSRPPQSRRAKYQSGAHGRPTRDDEDTMTDNHPDIVPTATEPSPKKASSREHTDAVPPIG